MEEYKNEWIDQWVGRAVVVKQLVGPDLDEELAEMINENLLNARTTPLASRTAVLMLESYDRLGVTLLTFEEPPFRTFVPWSAVLEISPVELENELDNTVR